MTPNEKAEENIQKNETETENLLDKFSESRKADVLPLLMDPTRSIDRYFASRVYEYLEGWRENKEYGDLDVVIHSSGGSASVAYHIGRMLQSYCDNKLTIIVPRYAKSAATLLACSADQIAMGPPSELGPIDPQIRNPSTGRWVSAASISGTIDRLKEIGGGPLLKEFAKRIPVMELGSYEEMQAYVGELVEELLERRMLTDANDGKIKDVKKELVETHHHGKPITATKAEEIGLSVKSLSKEEWGNIWEIFRRFEKGVLVRGGEE